MQLKENQKIVEEIIISHDISEDSDASFELFRENFDLILKYGNMIIKTPELYYCSFRNAHLSIAYFGDYQIPLGALLYLWNKNSLIDKCDNCQGNLYLYCAGGSPLSGSNNCCGICRDCKTVSCRRLPSFAPVVRTLEYVREIQNKRKILRTKGQSFSWKDGLVGKAVPDKIIDAGVSPVSMEELISILERCNSKNIQTIPEPKNAQDKTTKDKIINVEISDFFKNIRV